MLASCSTMQTGKGFFRGSVELRAQVQRPACTFQRQQGLDIQCAKKAMLEREKKRKLLVIKYFDKRQELKAALLAADSFEEKLACQRELQKLPRDSAPCRLHNRCLVTGRPKAYYSDFGLSRHVLREWAHEGLLPGVTKSSW